MAIIRKVYHVKGTGQLLVSIPKDEGIVKGDYVKIEKVEVNDESE